MIDKRFSNLILLFLLGVYLLTWNPPIGFREKYMGSINYKKKVRETY